VAEFFLYKKALCGWLESVEIQAVGVLCRIRDEAFGDFFSVLSSFLPIEVNIVMIRLRLNS
jgi:hypothetical protein